MKTKRKRLKKSKHFGMTAAVEKSCKKRWGWYSVAGGLIGEGIGIAYGKAKGESTMTAASNAVPVAVASILLVYLLGSAAQCART
ncbi:MAG: hypothetical protein ABH877_02490 [bacterium]